MKNILYLIFLIELILVVSIITESLSNPPEVVTSISVQEIVEYYRKFQLLKILEKEQEILRTTNLNLHYILSVAKYYQGDYENCLEILRKIIKEGGDPYVSYYSSILFLKIFSQTNIINPDEVSNILITLKTSTYTKILGYSTFLDIIETIYWIRTSNISALETNYERLEYKEIQPTELLQILDYIEPRNLTNNQFLKKLITTISYKLSQKNFPKNIIENYVKTLHNLRALDFDWTEEHLKTLVNFFTYYGYFSEALYLLEKYKVKDDFYYLKYLNLLLLTKDYKKFYEFYKVAKEKYFKHPNIYLQNLYIKYLFYTNQKNEAKKEILEVFKSSIYGENQKLEVFNTYRNLFGFGDINTESLILKYLPSSKRYNEFLQPIIVYYLREGKYQTALNFIRTYNWKNALKEEKMKNDFIEALLYLYNGDEKGFIEKTLRIILESPISYESIASLHLFQQLTNIQYLHQCLYKTINSYTNTSRNTYISLIGLKLMEEFNVIDEEMFRNLFSEDVVHIAKKYKSEKDQILMKKYQEIQKIKLSNENYVEVYKHITQLKERGMYKEAIEALTNAIKILKFPRYYFFDEFVMVEDYRNAIYAMWNAYMENIQAPFKEILIERDLKYFYPIAYGDVIEKLAEEYGIEKWWIYALVWQECRYDALVVSRSFAMGLAQLLRSTAEYVARKKLTLAEIFDTENNLSIGVKYLKNLIDSFDGNILLALAGYNGGPHNVKKWLKEFFGRENLKNLTETFLFVEMIRFAETKNYVKEILVTKTIYKLLYERGFFYETSETLLGTKKE